MPSVSVGNVKLGRGESIKIQSMTTSNTRDVEATVNQIIRLADAGCDIARVTVQGKKEAEACEEIKNLLVQKGYNIPIVADIHFYPPAALMVADFVDKIRINPGNYIDRRATFKSIDYDDATYLRELKKIEEGFLPLVEKCKKRGIAMRIGTNHGSLSDRIMSRYGDTPFGMVESALEFARVCEKYDYHNLVFSMKSSNPIVMIEAYRLLASKIGDKYPLHLGVTEAGEGEDGRVKSSIGIGTLLLEGLGDTIRFSLTEDPWFEIDPCRRLVEFVNRTKRRPRGERISRNVRFPKGVSDGIVIFDQKDLHPDMVVFSDLDHAIELLPEIDAPVILRKHYDVSPEDLVIHASCELGSILADGLAEGIWIEGDYDQKLLHDLSHSIMQAVRKKSIKTEFIACPGCGRTLFNLQEVTKRIKSKTGHLPNVKIAIMGCIVNGPGEMADANFGYVGSQSGKIDLYVGKQCVERNIDEKDADEKLIDLIKAQGMWSDPS
ncbi:MAG: (E)-4-hydroxy-3-methylbut-2-enyl-diphosphate synthase [Chlamydiae bacterium]|nr:(E)-4-hydroxy-3-methylbut-2-enyl-diphosphate synthase [Chlamydiota bacterium]